MIKKSKETLQPGGNGAGEERQRRGEWEKRKERGRKKRREEEEMHNSQLPYGQFPLTSNK